MILFERYRNKSKQATLLQSEKKKSNLAYAFFKKFPINLTSNKKKLTTERRVEDISEPRTSVSLPNIPASLTTYTINNTTTANNINMTTSTSTPKPKAYTTKQRKRHSAEQRRRHNQLLSVQDVNRHSITFGYFPHQLSTLTKAELLLDPDHVTKLDKLSNLPDNTSFLLEKLGKPPILVPHRSLSHQHITPKQQRPLSRMYSESHKMQHANPLEPEQLVDLLLHSSHSAILVDVRNLLDFQKRRIRGSLNVNLPSLLIKRYQRRGAVSNFNLENFITMGRETYCQKNHAAATFIVYDETMSENDQTSQAWTLINLLSNFGQVFYLRGGFNSFAFQDWIESSGISSGISSGPPAVVLPLRSVSYTIGESRLYTLDTKTTRKHRPQQVTEECTFTISEIIPGFLYLGPEIETIDQSDQLQQRQIKRVLNMAEECNDEGLSKQTIVYHKIAARDTVEMKNIELVMMEAVYFIEEAKKHHEPIYVHCKAGKSRSVTAILAYLVTSEGWTLKRAYRHVIKARPNISPNIGFISELIKMEGKVHGRVSSFLESDWQTTSLPSPEYAKELFQLSQAWQTAETIL